jgi:hypothetical protein
VPWVADRLYGRDQLVDELGRAEAPLTLITGDSGVGKTRVLEAAALARAGWLNAPPRQLALSDGALQQGVVDGLAHVAAEVTAEQGRARELGERMAAAAASFASEQVQELGRAIGAELLEIVRSRLGPKFGNALADYVRHLRTQSEEALAARLAALAEESTAAALASVAGEVVAFAGGPRIALHFDAGERLSEREWRILGDLAERLPERMHVRIAVATFRAPLAARVSDLRLHVPSCHEIPIPPLDEESVGSWLADAGVDLEIARAMRSTGGYPLHMGDLIRDLERGGTVSDAPLNEQVARRTESSWNALSAGARAVARRLCVLSDPLPRPRLQALVGLDAAVFGATVEELVRARIFPSRVDGEPWFHEQRRAFVRRRLTDVELDEAATAAAAAVWAELSEAYDPRWVTEFAALAADAKTLQREDPKVAAVLSLREPEHALLAAIVELATPENRGGGAADQLFRHARAFTDAEIEPISTLAALEDAHLVATASNEHATVVFPALTAKAVAVIEGSARDRLKRHPVEQLITLVLEVGFRGPLGDFAEVRCGVGDPSMGGLARMAGGGDPEGGFHAKPPNREDPGLHLIGRASYADRPLWFIGSYDDIAARERALVEVSSTTTDLFGEPLSVTDVLRHPVEPVPAQRFVNAAVRAGSVDAFGLTESGDLRVELDSLLPRERLEQVRVEAARVIRARASLLERYAMELDEPFAIYWDESDSHVIECTVYGGEEHAVHVPGLLELIGESQRYVTFAIERELGLTPPARFQNYRGTYGQASSYDPVFTELARRRQRAHLFNSAQPQRVITLESQTLESLTREGFLRLVGDARALASVMVREPAPLPPTELCVFVLAGEPMPGWVAGAGSSVLAVERESEARQDAVHFAFALSGVDVSDGWPTAVGDVTELFRSVFGFSPEDVEALGAGTRVHDVFDLLREYVGLSRHDYDLRWP